MLTRVSHPRIQRPRIPQDSFWIWRESPLLVVRTTELHTDSNTPPCCSHVTHGRTSGQHTNMSCNEAKCCDWLSAHKRPPAECTISYTFVAYLTDCSTLLVCDLGHSGCEFLACYSLRVEGAVPFLCPLFLSGWVYAHAGNPSPLSCFSATHATVRLGRGL